MCVNKKRIEMKNSYFEVAEIVGKQFLSYVLVDSDMKIGKIYELLKERWEKRGVKCNKDHFSRLLKNVYVKKLYRDTVKITVLSAIIDAAFNHPDIYKYVVARMTADGKTELIKVMHDMQQHYIDSEPNDEIYRYLKPARLSESEGSKKYYRQGKMKNILPKGYDGGGYEVTEDEPFQDNIDAVIRRRKRRGEKLGNL
jgi:hypothetical protein